MKNVFKFAQEVKAEAGKVTWPSLRDTRMMTLMVVLLVIFFSIYLWLADWALASIIRWILGGF